MGVGANSRGRTLPLGDPAGIHLEQRTKVGLTDKVEVDRVERGWCFRWRNNGLCCAGMMPAVHSKSMLAVPRVTPSLLLLESSRKLHHRSSLSREMDRA